MRLYCKCNVIDYINDSVNEVKVMFSDKKLIEMLEAWFKVNCWLIMGGFFYQLGKKVAMYVFR